MGKKLYSIAVALLLFFVSLYFPSFAHAQNIVVSPTFNCLGPCSSTQPSGTSTGTGANANVSSQPMPSSPTANDSGSNSSSQPCSSSLPNLSGQHTNSTDLHRRRRGGFLEKLFELFLALLSALLGGSGSGSLPCSPSSTISTQPVMPSSAPQPTTSSSSSSSSSSSTSSTSSTTSPANVPTEMSDNWGGYVTTTTFPTNSKITSDWVVAALDCSGGDGTISPWPGFGGWDKNDPNIAQLGNDMACSNGKATYPAWTEAFPANSVYSNNTMKAGDHMTATVTFQGGGKFATTMTNITQGWTINTPMDFKDASYNPKTAEVIFEALNGSTNNSGGSSQKIPVPKFAPQSFTNAVYSTGAQQSPLAAGPALKKINIGVNNDVQVTTGPISGSNFTQTFVHN